jgi:hypothetical protein
MYNNNMSRETITQMAKATEKARKLEKSQAELRVVLEQKLITLKPTLQEGIREYEEALKDGIFEDAEIELEGTGVSRKETMQTKLNDLFDRAEKIKAKLDRKETLSQATPEISISYNHLDGKKETIALDLEAKLQDFVSFYKKTKVDLPPNFKDTIRDLWERNQTEIEQAIEQNGFDEMLIVPATPDIGKLSEKMKMENGYFDYIKSSSTVQILNGIPLISQNVDKPRLILVHKTQNLKDRPELEKTLNIKGQDVKMDQALTLEDYLVFQRKYFEETGKHLDEYGWTWLATKAGARLVTSRWDPGAHGLYVYADVVDSQDDYLGVRPSRCFF